LEKLPKIHQKFT